MVSPLKPRIEANVTELIKRVLGVIIDELWIVDHLEMQYALVLWVGDVLPSTRTRSLDCPSMSYLNHAATVQGRCAIT